MEEKNQAMTDSSHEERKDPLDDPDEMAHFKQVVSAFFNYSIDAMRDLARMERDFNKIDPKYIKYMSPNFKKERIDRMKRAVLTNSQLLSKMVAEHQSMFDFEKLPNGLIALKPMFVKPTDIIKMRSTIKSFLRDWSVEGQAERDQCYKPIFDEVNEYFKSPIKENGQRVSVLHPGCGLGRLVFDFALKGYKSQGNEFAYFMLLASNFILNFTEKREQYEVYPFIHSFSNLKTESQAFLKVKIPDICPNEVMTKDKEYDFSMVAGEFVEIYDKQVEQWDCVVTCFFLDTAHNVIEYIECIHKILKKGGLWVNIGPLLYHYSEQPNEIQIELPWEEIEKIIPKFGFSFRKKEWRDCVYTNDKDSMMQMIYKTIFFSAVKEK